MDEDRSAKNLLHSYYNIDINEYDTLKAEFPKTYLEKSEKIEEEVERIKNIQRKNGMSEKAIKELDGPDWRTNISKRIRNDVCENENGLSYDDYEKLGKLIDEGYSPFTRDGKNKIRSILSKDGSAKLFPN